MSAIAESVRMTRYSMSCTELPLKLLQRLPATGFYVRASSTDPRKCLPCVHLLQQPLVGGRILQNHLRLTVHRKDQWNTHPSPSTGRGASGQCPAEHLGFGCA